MEQFEDLNWQEAAVKGRSKSEIYAIMVTKGKYYMPPQSQATSDFIHDIMVLKQKDINLIHVPQIKGLRINQILEEARKHINIDMYMPDLNEDKLPNREFVLNVVNTLIPKYLQEMIEKALEEREENYISKRSINMKVLPEFRRMFEETKEVSRNNGRFYQLVRNTEKRRQSKVQKEVIDKKNEEIKLEISMRDKAIQELQRKVQTFDQLESENDKNSEILSRLYDSGIIDENGALVRNIEKPEDME